MRKPYFLLPAIALFSPALAHAEFSDVPEGSEYYEPVSALEELGIVEGYADGSFGLNLPVNRAEFLKMAYLAEAKHHPDRRPWNSPISIFDSEEESTPNEEEISEEVSKSKLFPFGEEDMIKVDPPCFPDFTSKEWFEPYVCWGKEQGLVKGYPDGTFKAIQGVNFAEAAKMLVETSGKFDMDVEEDWFRRYILDQIDHWAEGYIMSLGDRTIPSSIQAVDQQLTRGEVAKLIYYYTLIPNDIPVENQTFTIFLWNGERFLNLKRLVRESLDSPYYYYAKGEGEVYYSDSSSGWLDPLEKVEGADADSFETIYLNISIHQPAAVTLDKNHVYSEGKVVEGSAGGFFKLLDERYFMEEGMTNFYYYAQDQEHVHLISCYNGGNPSPCYYKNILEDSDLNTFKILGSLYSKDSQNVYFKDEKLPNANAGSFDLVTGFLAKDDKQAYFNGEVLSGVDPNTIQIKSGVYPYPGMSETSQGQSFTYAYSSNLVFDANGEPVPNSAGGEFKLLSDSFSSSSDSSGSYNYGVDSKYAYLISCYAKCSIKLIPNSQAASFQALGEGWSKDAERVYFWETPVEGADPTTIQSLGDGYFRDSLRLYFEGKTVAGVNPNDFQVLHSDEELFCTVPYGQTQQSLFLGSTSLPEVDKATFARLDSSGFFFKDKNHIYHANLDGKGDRCSPKGMMPLEEIDKESFEPFTPHYFGSGGKIYYTSFNDEITLLESADDDSFEPLYPIIDSEAALDNIAYAKDKNYVYASGKIVQGVDAASFRYDETKNHWVDINGTYESYQLYKRTIEE